MNSNPDTLRSFLIGLLDYFSPTGASPSGGVGGGDLSQGLRSELQGASSASRQGSDVSSEGTHHTETGFDMPPLSELGEMPAVQTHFQSLLKRRLQSEIELRPPLFPWETELQDYPVVAATLASPWLAQLRSLSLPTQLPEAVLTTLLNRCQTVLQEALQPGVQLVKAVEALFPEQPEAVNQIAGLVLAGATGRDDSPEGRRRLDGLENAFPEGYSGANPQQQVTLAMLAAQEIFDALTLEVSAIAPTVQRLWETDQGPLTVTVRHGADALQVTAQCPGPGSLVLSGQGEAVSQAQGGTLSLTLPQPEPGRFYPLEVSLGADAATTLTFSLVVR